MGYCEDDKGFKNSLYVLGNRYDEANDAHDDFIRPWTCTTVGECLKEPAGSRKDGTAARVLRSNGCVLPAGRFLFDLSPERAFDLTERPEDPTPFISKHTMRQTQSEQTVNH